MGTGEDDDASGLKEENALLRAAMAAMTAAMNTITAAHAQPQPPQPPPAPAARPTSADITVARLAERYRKRTARAGMWNLAHVLKHFGERPVASLRRSDWLEYREIRQEATTKMGRPPKISTLNTELAQTLAMMRWAVDNEIIDANPFERVKKLKGQRSRETEIDPRELDAALTDAPLLVRVFQITCNETGMRNGSEVRRMEWTHIDWAQSRIELPAAHTKTRKRREVPMSEYLKTSLRELPRVVGSRYVFANPATKDAYSRGYLHSLSRPYLNRLTPAPGDGRVVTHDARHGLVSRLIRLGMPTFKSMKIVGHQSASTHWKYDHLADSDRNKAKGLLDDERKAPRRAPDETPVDKVQNVKLVP